MLYEPAYLKAKTGQDTFNGGLNGVGGVADSWAMMRFIHDRYPSSRRRYLWLVEGAAAAGRALRYRGFAVVQLAQLLAREGIAWSPKVPEVRAAGGDQLLRVPRHLADGGRRTAASSR